MCEVVSGGGAGVGGSQGGGEVCGHCGEGGGGGEGGDGEEGRGYATEVVKTRVFVCTGE